MLGGSPHRWLLIPAGFILGFTTIMAEPTVRVHSIEVEKVSSGYIKKTSLFSPSPPASRSLSPWP